MSEIAYAEADPERSGTPRPGEDPHKRAQRERAARALHIEARTRAIHAALAEHPLARGITRGQIRAVLHADERLRRGRSDDDRDR